MSLTHPNKSEINNLSTQQRTAEQSNTTKESKNTKNKTASNSYSQLINKQKTCPKGV
jgi:hypothetical protein